MIGFFLNITISLNIISQSSTTNAWIISFSNVRSIYYQGTFSLTLQEEVNHLGAKLLFYLSY